MRKDLNKHIDSIKYNQLNLPEEIIFENGNRIKYYYDAAGTKWRKEVTDSVTNTTDYVGSLILKNDTLKTIQTAEGRIVDDMVGQTYHYQYYLKDHLGNVRLTFGAEPDTTIYTATMESELSSEEEAQFANIADYRQISTQFNHTTGGVATPNESVMLNSTLMVNSEPRTTAAMKSLKLQVGDTVNMEVWAKHPGTDQSSEINASTFLFAALTSGFGLISTGETALAHEGFKHVFETILLHDQSPGDVPTAYLNYIFFNDDYDTAESKRVLGLKQISSAAEDNFEKLTLDFVAPESGYLYVYVSNESNLDVNVYFDDLKITHKSSLSIVQADDYYPGVYPAESGRLSFNSFNDTTEIAQNYLYNGKELQNDLNLDWYDYGARFYDASLGRWHCPDPLAENSITMTPYHYVANNPLIFVDPDGMDWFYYKAEGEDDASYHYHEGNEYTHTYSYTDKNGEVQTKDITLQGSEYLVEYSITGKNDEGASVGTINVYKQDKIVHTQDGVFTGNDNYSGTEPADKGVYHMALNVRDSDGPQKMNSNGDNPLPYYGAQKIPENGVIEYNGQRYYNTPVTSAYGNGRIRLQPSEDVRKKNLARYGSARQDRGLYLHGKKDSHNWTHGCVCNKNESVFNYLWNNVFTKTPFVIK